MRADGSARPTPEAKDGRFFEPPSSIGHRLTSATTAMPAIAIPSLEIDALTRSDGSELTCDAAPCDARCDDAAAAQRKLDEAPPWPAPNDLKSAFAALKYSPRDIMEPVQSV